MAFDHLLWSYKQVPNGMLVTDLHGYSDDWRILKGLDLSAEFPSDAFCEMNPDFPDNTIPTDHVRNRDQLILISERLKQLLEACAIPNLQFLQVTIKDHKKRPLATPYFIVNPVGLIACFDEKKSQPTYSELDTDKVDKMEAFVPDEEQCKDLPDVFRPKGFYHIMISRRLAQQIEAAGMTGNGYVDPDRLAGEDIPVSLRGMTRK